MDSSKEHSSNLDEVKRRSPHKAVKCSTVFDVSFLRSTVGVLLIAQMICSFLGLVIGSSWRGHYVFGHVLFLLSISMLFFCSLGLLIARAIRIGELISKNIAWNVIFAFYSPSAAICSLITSCIMIEDARAASSLKAAAVFGLLSWSSLLCLTILHMDVLLKRFHKSDMPTVSACVVSGLPQPDNHCGEDDDDWSDNSTEQEESVTLTHVTPRLSSAAPQANFGVAALHAHPDRSTIVVHE